MNTVTQDKANFGWFVGSLESLENNEAFASGDGSYAMEGLSSVFNAFREARDKGWVDDENWIKIEAFTGERATAYRVAKGKNGRMDVLWQIRPAEQLHSEDPKVIKQWFDAEIARVSSRADACLYLDDLRFARNEMVKLAKWNRTQPWIVGSAGLIFVGVAGWAIKRRMMSARLSGSKEAYLSNVREVLEERLEIFRHAVRFIPCLENEIAGDLNDAEERVRRIRSLSSNLEDVVAAVHSIESIVVKGINEALHSGAALSELAKDCLNRLYENDKKLRETRWATKSR